MIYPVGEAIRDARIMRGMSQLQLARAAGVTDRAISYWEKGHKVPGLELLAKLAGALHVEFVVIGEGVLWRGDPRG